MKLDPLRGRCKPAESDREAAAREALEESAYALDFTTVADLLPQPHNVEPANSPDESPVVFVRIAADQGALAVLRWFTDAVMPGKKTIDPVLRLPLLVR